MPISHSAAIVVEYRVVNRSVLNDKKMIKLHSRHIENIVQKTLVRRGRRTSVLNLCSTYVSMLLLSGEEAERRF